MKLLQCRALCAMACYFHKQSFIVYSNLFIFIHPSDLKETDKRAFIGWMVKRTFRCMQLLKKSGDLSLLDFNSRLEYMYWNAISMPVPQLTMNVMSRCCVSN